MHGTEIAIFHRRKQTIWPKKSKYEKKYFPFGIISGLHHQKNVLYQHKIDGAEAYKTQ